VEAYSLVFCNPKHLLQNVMMLGVTVKLLKSWGRGACA